MTGATAGNVVGLLAARHTLLAQRGWDVESDGLAQAPPVRVLVGDEVHPSVLQALQMTVWEHAACTAWRSLNTPTCSAANGVVCVRLPDAS